MLTLKKLKEMKPRTVFAKGKIVDSPKGISMTDSGNLLRWMAVKGGAHDWAIYCHFVDKDWEWIRFQGQKVMGKEKIIKLVPCDDEAFDRYRY